jgi:hypothetical protein
MIYAANKLADVKMKDKWYFEENEFHRQRNVAD